MLTKIADFHCVAGNVTSAMRIRQRLKQTRGAWGKSTDKVTMEAEIKVLRDEWQRPWEHSETASD